MADTILSCPGLNVPILVQAYPDDLEAFNVNSDVMLFAVRFICAIICIDAFNFTLTSLRTSKPLSNWFKKDLEKFISVCHVVKGLRTARLGAIGARPGAFNTVRYSEKILQATGITVTTVDLY